MYTITIRFSSFEELIKYISNKGYGYKTYNGNNAKGELLHCGMTIGRWYTNRGILVLSYIV